MSPLDFLTWTGLIALACVVYAAIILVFIGALHGINANQKSSDALDAVREERDHAKSSLVRLQAVMGRLASDALDRCTEDDSTHSCDCWLVAPSEIRECIRQSAMADAEGAAVADLGYIPADLEPYYETPVEPTPKASPL